MEDRGHKCTLLLYDRHGSDMSKAIATIRQHWPWMRANILPVPDVIEGFDGCVASSWDTAHVLASRGATRPTHRFYFIQDYEPYFYPRGSLYSLAEDSYRFGFRNIALGSMVAEALQDTARVPAVTVPFGCDGDTYSLKNVGPRNGVVFYARETVDRRGTLLGKLALAEFRDRHPEQVIHVYGDPLPSWGIPHQHHGKLSPTQLSRLYNGSLAGLALSFTNISLVAEEMLSCGMAPVVNDHAFARKDLVAAGVRWSPATPGGIADALCRAVEDPMSSTQTVASAAGARKDWVPAQIATASIIEAEAAACVP
jgi:glycosyltransferase involved in cell wall biosynthesis